LIQITQDIIDRVLEDSYDAYKQGKLAEFLQSVDMRIFNEQRFLAGYIEAGNNTIMAQHSGEEGKTISNGYYSACGLVFRMVDKKCTQDGITVEIIEDDVNRANQRAELREEMHGTIRLETRIMELTQENTDFGNYLVNYLTHHAPNELIAMGFAIGAISTYSLYEQAFARTRK